ncbi:phage major capsid protein [Bifidobacterium choerinum]|uniref:Phage major capsid protein, HK97 family n=1 Tax=Bifidobacterium choerinum TaxID=35760 RepID=A0A087AH89_9BIFI|nr:phage major capsid protein [Bifidobacterium choerinum]KFI58139.1 phage major capsid protein, HK97 family [Bifidobacterium choerinum]
MPVFKTTITKAAFADTNLLPPDEVIKEAVALNTNCATPTVTIQGDAPRVRIPYVETDPTAGVVAEGAEITQTSAALNEIEIATHKVALTIPITNEALTYTDATKLVSTSAANAVTNKVDAMFLSAAADSAAGAPAGLAKLDGLTTETVTELKDLSPILNVLSAITDHGAEPSALVMRYSVWARLMALTAKDGRPLIAPDVTSSAEPRLFNVPVFFNSYAAADTVLALSAKDVFVSVSQVEAAVSKDALFTYDSSVMRLVMRFGYGLAHPERLGKVVLPAA